MPNPVSVFSLRLLNKRGTRPPKFFLRRIDLRGDEYDDAPRALVVRRAFSGDEGWECAMPPPGCNQRGSVCEQSRPHRLSSAMLLSGLRSPGVAMEGQCRYHERPIENGAGAQAVPGRSDPLGMERRMREETGDRGCFRTLLVGGLVLLCLAPLEAFSQQEAQPVSPRSAEELVLERSFVCESLKDNSPVNAGTVFSMGIGRVVCLTSFTPASQKTVVFHSWFRRGQLSNKHRVSISPSGSAALSSIQLREADKGPWHVEISDSSGRILNILRFSIVD
jgi:hypothetical protein